ncbi:MAG: AI-2E family transporter [Patescibacteria group bacterium]
MKEGKDVTISITTGTIVRGVMFIVCLLLLFYIRDIVLVILAAIVLASSVEPATKWFARWKIRRLPAVILIYIILGLLFAGFLLFFLPSLLNEMIVYLSSLPQNLSLNDLWNPIQESGLWGFGNAVNLPGGDLPIKEIADGAKSFIADTQGGAIRTASIIFGGALSFILIMVLSFYLAVQEDGVADFLRIVTPVKKHEYVIGLWKRTQLKIGYWMQGQLLLGLIVGVLVYLGLLIFGVEHALLLASLAAMFEIIPLFGPVLAAIPAVIIATVDGGVTIGLLVAGWYIIIQQFENHLLYPLVVKKIVGISPILVILALVIGAKLAGFLGALLAVPIAAALREYISDVEKNKHAVSMR